MVKLKSEENKNELSFREKQLVEFIVEVSIYLSYKNSKNQNQPIT